MMCRLIRWLLHKFNYELVSFAQMKFLNDAVNYRTDICQGKYDLEFAVCWDGYGCCYNVVTKMSSPAHITVKHFYIEDYGSEEYAYACAQELCDKLNEKL